MKQYKVETHMHTSEASLCGEATAAEMVDALKERGYDSAFVTDHFFNGNTAISADLPWEERVNLFYKGFENAKKRGDEIGINIFFGFEFNNRGNEFLTYNISREWLIENPQIMDMSIEEYLKFVRSEGGFVIHAHPFREAWYVQEMRTFPDLVDAIEVFNGKNTPERTNERALALATEHNLPMTSGSDAHKPDELLCGCLFDKPILTPNDFIKQLKIKSQRLCEYYYK